MEEEMNARALLEWAWRIIIVIMLPWQVYQTSKIELLDDFRVRTEGTEFNMEQATELVVAIERLKLTVENLNGEVVRLRTDLRELQRENGNSR